MDGGIWAPCFTIRIVFPRQPSLFNTFWPAYAFLGLCEYETGNYDEALAQFRAWAAAGWAGTPELRDVAVFHFALLLTRDGRFVESLYLLATDAQLAGDIPELAEAMGLASLRMRNLPGGYPPEQRERIWLAGKAALYAAQSPRDYARADEFATRLETLYPQQPDVHYFRGTIYTFEEKTVEAEREYREELKISPKHIPSLDGLAAIDLDKSDLAEAGELARRAAMSPRHFTRVFTDEVGEAPGHYVERIRTEAARRQLEETEDTVVAIAARCGFGTAETMRRNFIRRVGVSPDQYRKAFA